MFPRAPLWLSMGLHRLRMHLRVKMRMQKTAMTTTLNVMRPVGAEHLLAVSQQLAVFVQRAQKS